MALESSQLSVVIALAVCTALAVSIVGVRLILRFCIIKNASADDFVIILALMALLVFVGFCSAEVAQAVALQHGRGSSVFLLREIWASIIAYQSSLAAAKASILLQYMRFLATPRSRTLCWIMIGISATTGIVFDIIIIFLCTPISGFWQPTATTQCLSRTFQFLTYSTINIVTDLIIIVFPIPILLTLRISTREMVGIIALFAIGGATCIVTILRLNSLIIVSRAKRFSGSNDFVAFWSTLEITTAILCASLPGIRPLFKMSWKRKNQVKRRWSRKPIDDDDIVETRYEPKAGATVQSIFGPTLADKKRIGVDSWADIEEVEGLSEKHLERAPEGVCHGLCVYGFFPKDGDEDREEGYSDVASSRLRGDSYSSVRSGGDRQGRSCRIHGLPMPAVPDKDIQ
ncbi:hypothetical protein BP6252_10110 [Coleophoma cylindrospora]|uniref:Rhodopsin domain-containing protein n=1 Tax=Coleophoma cylindrospora TaxID=1849047 RepID=A0A3D8QXI4_9HELO|nr:hypothetical protein BP6252_10110 [Coleophoma cylindrospora]